MTFVAGRRRHHDGAAPSRTPTSRSSPATSTSGQNPSVVASAYTNNDTDGATATTLFGLDSSRDALVRQGAVDGNPLDVAGGASPNGGLLTTIGSLGLDVIDASLDIARGPAPGGNVAYAALQPSSGTLSQLGLINLTSGAATLGGAIGDKPLAAMALALGGALRVAVPATVTSEAAGQAVVTVERTGDTLAAARVGFRTADRTAVAGLDYVATAGTLEFAAGERTKQITVGLLQNSASEGAKRSRSRSVRRSAAPSSRRASM